MKTIIIITGSLLWSILFFEQWIGINVFLFSLLTLGGILLIQKEIFLKKQNYIFIFGLIASSFFVFYYGAIFPLIMFAISLIIISTLNYPEKISILSRPILCAISSLDFWFVQWLKKLEITEKSVEEENKKNDDPNLILKYTALIGFSILIVLLFFFLYRNSNEFFKEITDSIQIDISPELFGFTILGIFVCNVIFNTTLFKNWSDYESNLPEMSEPMIVKDLSFLKMRNLIFLVLLVLLNIQILFINIIDISAFSGMIELQKNTNLSETVHEAIGAIIFSVIVAMVLILFIYKKSQTKSKVVKTLLFLSVAWVIQNFILVLTTFQKNNDYILMHDLTYKRIGVMIYLMLTLIGLAIVFIKLTREKSNWFVFRKVSYFFYSILLILSFFNWPVIVTEYNLNSALEKGEIDDVEYLLNLDSRNASQLYLFSKEHPEYFTETEQSTIITMREELLSETNHWQEFTISGYQQKQKLK